MESSAKPKELAKQKMFEAKGTAFQMKVPLDAPSQPHMGYYLENQGELVELIDGKVLSSG